MRMLSLLAVLLLTLAAGPAEAQSRVNDFGRERISFFQSDVTINPDGTLTVKETIRFYAYGLSIKRGIVREFPTKYEDRDGTRVTVRFDLESVTRDGKEEPWFIESVDNGVEIFIGDENVFLDRGEHEYVLTYTTSDQLGFFENHDELYWNVTGNGWIFEIEQAEAIIRLPNGAQSTMLEVFTGRQGSVARNATIAETSPGVVTARTTRALRAEEGMTIAVAWPKGVIEEPGFFYNLWRFIVDNLGAGIALIAAGGLGFFYYRRWLEVGKDPDHGTIIPLFNPPKDFSPADARYLRKMGFDNKVLAATIVALATKGKLKIEEDDGLLSSSYKLIRQTEDMEGLTSVERGAITSLFASGDELELKNKNYARLQAAVAALKRQLEKTHEPANFKSNAGSAATGLLFLVPMIGGVFIFQPEGFPLILAGIAIAASIIAIIVFFRLMMAPTPAGQKLRDEIEGFRMFLGTAEQQRWAVLNPPKMTPEFFEKNLPYALALDVEHEWSETFEREMRLSDPNAMNNYHPSWYGGRNFRNMRMTTFASAIGTSLNRAVSSSATPPGKSSGFGGGGFSGGGGGGGGGRGW